MTPRELKFRGWDGKKMIHPTANMLIESYAGVPVWQFGYELNPMSDVVLMQYTGLKDSQGKELWEGDIVEDNNGHISSVVWNEKSAMFMYYSKELNHFCVMDIPTMKVEKIGNVFESPDLLPQTK